MSPNIFIKFSIVKIYSKPSIIVLYLENILFLRVPNHDRGGNLLKKGQTRGTCVAQLVKQGPSAQVMILGYWD